MTTSNRTARLRIYDVRVDCPPHYDTFADFQYSYHYGECRIPASRAGRAAGPHVRAFHRLHPDTATGRTPVARTGWRWCRILEACSESLQTRGGPVPFPGASRPTTPVTTRTPAAGWPEFARDSFPMAGRSTPTPCGSRRMSGSASGVELHAFVNLYGCEIGEGTRIGCFVEIQRNARIGARCKISSHSFICEGVTLEDEVFIGHGVMFTNDKYPRATMPDGTLAADRRLGMPAHAGETRRVDRFRLHGAGRRRHRRARDGRRRQRGHFGRAGSRHGRRQSGRGFAPKRKGACA